MAEVRIEPSYLIKEGGIYIPVSPAVVEMALDEGLLEWMEDEYPNVYVRTKKQ